MKLTSHSSVTLFACMSSALLALSTTKSTLKSIHTYTTTHRNLKQTQNAALLRAHQNLPAAAFSLATASLVISTSSGLGLSPGGWM